MKSGQQTQFWLGRWIGDTPLQIEFWQLFQICVDPDISVSGVWQNGQWQLTFRRSLNKFLLNEWMRLQELLNEVHLNSERDEVF